MRTSIVWAAALVTFSAISMGGCASPQDVNEIKAKVDEMQAGQKDILAKLDALGKGQKQLLAKAPAAAPAAKAQEDPNKVYDVPVGKSFYKGPEDATVALVEFSDFQ